MEKVYIRIVKLYLRSVIQNWGNLNVWHTSRLLIEIKPYWLAVGISYSSTLSSLDFSIAAMLVILELTQLMILAQGSIRLFALSD